MTPYIFQEIPYFLMWLPKLICITLKGGKNNSEYLKTLVTKFAYTNENISKVNLIECYSAFFFIPLT